MRETTTIRGNEPWTKPRMDDQTIVHPVTKVVTVWAAIGITSWADFASFLAAVYSAILLGEWCWKRVIKPLLISRGIIKKPRVRSDEYTGQ